MSQFLLDLLSINVLLRQVFPFGAIQFYVKWFYVCYVIFCNLQKHRNHHDPVLFLSVVIFWIICILAEIEYIIRGYHSDNKTCFFFNLALKSRSWMNHSPQKHWFFKLQIKNTNTAKSEVRFKQLITVVIQWSVHNRLFNVNFDKTPVTTQ
jgi:hypothetical protein